MCVCVCVCGRGSRWGLSVFLWCMSCIDVLVQNTHELTKIREQLKNMEKEKKTLEDKVCAHVDLCVCV